MGQKAKTARIPAYYLEGHAIELALKSVILNNDPGNVDSIKTLGHNLELCLKKVRSVNCSVIEFMNENHQYCVRILNDNYKIKRFEYMMTGGISLPDWDILISFTDALLKKIASEIPYAKRVLAPYKPAI